MSKVSISKLIKDGLQTRVGVDEATVRKYAEAMGEKKAGGHPCDLGKIVVYRDPGTGNLYLADGFHRVEAAQRCGCTSLDAKIERGGYVNALRYALGCNALHGKPTTNEDKQNALRIAWEHRRELFGPKDPTASWLAQTCGVSRRTAEEFYAEISANCGDLTPQRQGENGRNYTLPQRPQRPVTQPMPTPKRPQRPVAQVKAPTRPVYRDAEGRPHCVPVDCYGNEIPTHLQAAFDATAKDTLAQVLRSISEARTAITREREAGNPIFTAMRQEVLVQLDNAYSFAKAADPHCVCRMCQGQGCKACHGRGWQTEEEYGRNPNDFKHKGVQA